MIEASTTLKTEHAGKYLTQLCKHFAHKIDVSYDYDHGECRFMCGTAILDAAENALSIKAISPDEEQLQETQSVIERHLVRFAFREEIGPLQWQRRFEPVSAKGEA
ncbi:hypothetical protein SAMN03159496_02871 [Rhizobium sp. NFR07]|uniref:DUF2218 domain-containing protein n=1 Tax=Rhizobium sp. NFR07 TaxID=1566262 RepID=UPI0008DF5BE2|nr:DUF2218 domain-containing protein [Rhizobium sp. NFR07]SFB31593.1 hypothetical protein SAMN03159496_02871 [Rhizobium sp. NFR07]